MMTSDDKVGGWVKKGQNHDDVILEWSLTEFIFDWYHGLRKIKVVRMCRNFVSFHGILNQ